MTNLRKGKILLNIFDEEIEIDLIFPFYKDKECNQSLMVTCDDN